MQLKEKTATTKTVLTSLTIVLLYLLSSKHGSILKDKIIKSEETQYENSFKHLILTKHFYSLINNIIIFLANK